MHRRNRMTKMAVADTIPAKILYPFGIEIEPPRKVSWIGRLLMTVGIAMDNPQTPRGWSFNPSVITLVITIAALLTAGGYYVGQKDAENRAILERLQRAETDAADAKKLAAYQAGVADVHSAENKSKEVKK